MLENILGRKIEIHPKVANENQSLCDKCGGTGWMIRDNKWLENCPHCSNGVIRVCPTCKQPYKARYTNHCDNKDCINTEQIQRNIEDSNKEIARFEKAIKLDFKDTPKDSVGMMYSESYGYNEGYFTDFDELIDYIDGEEFIDIPDYVWATSKIKLSIDADDILERATEDLHEDASDNIIAQDELQKFLDEWCDKQSGTDTFCVDYKYAIMVPENMKAGE